MHRQLRRPHVRVRRPLVMLTVALAGFATAALVGIAVAKSFTLKNDSNAQVTNQQGVTVHQGVVTNGKGFAVYTLSGDTAKHPKCTKANGCFKFWPPVKVSSAKKLTKAPGIKGKLGTWHHNGFMQVTLGGHPLYTFVNDSQKGKATGEGVQGFGGIWHVGKTSAPRGAATTAPTSTLPPPTTSTAPGTTMTAPPPPTTTTYPYPYPYPPPQQP